MPFNLSNPLIDLTEYATKKAAGLANLSLVGNDIVLSYNTFDQNTGLPLAPNTMIISSNIVKSEIDDCTYRLNALNSLLADINALPKPVA